MDKSTRYSPEVRERAVRMVFDHDGEYSTQWSGHGLDFAEVRMEGGVVALVGASSRGGPGLSIYQLCVQQALPRGRRRTFHGVHGRRLPQYDGRKFLRHTGTGSHQPPTLEESERGAHGDLLLARRLVQTRTGATRPPATCHPLTRRGRCYQELHRSQGLNRPRKRGKTNRELGRLIRTRGFPIAVANSA